MEIARGPIFGKVKVALLFALPIFLLFVFMASCAKQKIRNADSAGTGIICFGDSVTFGHGVRPQENYPSRLARLTKAPVVNAGLDTDSTYTALKRIESDVLSRNPRMVIICFGINDFILGIPLEETIDNVEKMIIRIQNSGAMVAIADPGTKTVMSAYSLEFERLSKKHAAILVPRLLEGKLAFISPTGGFIYPHSGGYEMIAQRVLRAIMPYLNHSRVLRKP